MRAPVDGRVLRVRGRGAPRKDGSKGDLLVKINVQLPRNLSEEERKLFEQLRDMRR